MVTFLRVVDVLLFAFLASCFVYIASFLDYSGGWSTIALFAIYFLIYLFVLNMKNKVMRTLIRQWRRSHNA